MRTSETIANITPAMVSFQDKVKGIKKDAQGHGYKYITLDSILALVRPVLTECGLLLVQDAHGDFINGENVASCETRIIHTSGEWIGTEKLTVKPVAIKGTTTPRDLGSAITYAKRYQLTALLGLSADVDDDAGAVSENMKAWGHKVTTLQLQVLTNLMKEKNIGKEKIQELMPSLIGSVKVSTELTQDEANKIIEHLGKLQ